MRHRPESSSLSLSGPSAAAGGGQKIRNDQPLSAEGAAGVEGVQGAGPSDEARHEASSSRGAEGSLSGISGAGADGTFRGSAPSDDMVAALIAEREYRRTHGDQLQAIMATLADITGGIGLIRGVIDGQKSEISGLKKSLRGQTAAYDEALGAQRKAMSDMEAGLRAFESRRTALRDSHVEADYPALKSG